MKSRLWTRNYIILLISNLFAAQSYTALQAVLPLYIREMGGDNALAGTMAGAFTLVMMLARPAVGMLMDRAKRHRIMLLGGAAFFLNTLAYLLANGIASLFAVRMLYGASTCLYTLATSTVVADSVPSERLVDGIGYFSISSSIAGAIGPFTGTFLYEHFSFQVLFAGLALISLAGTILLLFMSNVNKPAVPRKNDASEKHTAPKGIEAVLHVVEPTVILPAAVSGLTVIGYSAVTNFLPLYGVSQGIENISVFFIINGLCVVVARLLSNRLLGRVGTARAMILGLILIALGYLVMALAANFALIAAAGLLFGFGIGIASPMINALVFQLSPPERRGRANATYGLFNDVGNGLGAILWGNLSQTIGFVPSYLLAMAAPLLALLIYVVLLRRKTADQTENIVEKTLGPG